MLDKLGLDKKDGEGYRLRADGGGRLRLALTTYLGFLPFTQIAEMIVEQWKKIGIRGEVQELERGPGHRPACGPTSTRSTSRPSGAPTTCSATPRCSSRPTAAVPIGPLYGTWYSSAGAQGKTPPPRMRELMEKYRKAFGVPDAGADAAGQGGLEDRARRAVGHPGRLELARVSGRAGDQEQHGQHPGAALEQRGERQPAHRPHGDLVLQVVVRTVTVAAGWAGQADAGEALAVDPPARRAAAPGPASAAARRGPSTLTAAGRSIRSRST